MDWLRFYTSTLDKPKIQRLTGDLFKFWVNILCLAREQDDGLLPPIADIAFRLRCADVEAAQRQIDNLLKFNLLDQVDGGFRPHDWNDWQYESDNSTKRTRKFRERSRERCETFPERSRTETEQSRTEQTQSGARTLPWKRDQEYIRFTVDYLATGAALIDADFTEAFEGSWKSLNFDQKLERVAALHKHSAEYAANPRFVPKPLKFLREEWERPIRPAPNRVSDMSKTDAVSAMALRNMKEIGRLL